MRQLWDSGYTAGQREGFDHALLIWKERGNLDAAWAATEERVREQRCVLDREPSGDEPGEDDFPLRFLHDRTSQRQGAVKVSEQFGGQSLGATRLRSTTS